ncbi:unnamed protein product [Lactuca virosa]|uniref:EKC/KEOPS complex subunit TPRKB n=1 Tax=Lactuca virosa TaxID=75947 RepID=A0AAU9MMU1_9ASTR|nr:unnamed protein product [Lactuca virosa]
MLPQSHFTIIFLFRCSKRRKTKETKKKKLRKRRNEGNFLNEAVAKTAPPYTFLPLSIGDTSEMKHYEISGTTLSVALFTEVANSKELLELMQAGTLEPEVALLNASLIPDIFPVLAAAHKTLVSKSRDSLTTRTLHSELVYNYSGSKHISESLKRCGISDSTTYILAARFNASEEELNAMKTLIKGKEIDLEELEGRANKSQILKQYKITGVELGISTIGDAITCRIASRDAL